MPVDEAGALGDPAAPGPVPARVTAQRRAGDRPPSQAAEDAKLVARLGLGDGTALEALHTRYARPCGGLARRLLGDDGLAQDVVQEVFLALWRDPSKFDPTRGSFASWLLAMTHHKAVDAVRREENLRKRRTSSEVLAITESDDPRVDDAVWSGVQAERVRDALGVLPPAQREALLLAYFGGYTQREIAGITGTPLGTVKTRMLAGMRRLRDVLDGVATVPGESVVTVR